MEAVATAGYRAIAFDMRGYGRSSAPSDPYAYTAFHIVGDIVNLLDTLGIDQATLVGHDFGASMSWYSAMMRPDRFPAVFCMSVPFLPPGGPSLLEVMKSSGRDEFYMFDQTKPDAAERWADAKVTYPSFLYWSSGTPPEADRWDPFDRERPMYRKAPVELPPWADAEDMAYAIGEFERTGFAAPLNYYRSIQPFFDLARPFKGTLIRQPSFFLVGEVDGVNRIRQTTEKDLRAVVPGLRGFASLPGIGHWPQAEAPGEVNRSLLGFLASLDN